MKYDYSKKINIEDINSIYITGAGYIRKKFSGISNSSAMGWVEPVWGANLTRSSSFALENIDEIDIGGVRQVEIMFPVMTVDDFVILQAIMHERHCIVDAFYVDDMRRHSCEMAITTNERKRIYNYGSSILGMRDVKVKFVATNREDQDVQITYVANNGTKQQSSTSYEPNTQITIGSGLSFTNGTKHIARWCVYPNGYNLLEDFESDHLDFEAQSYLDGASHTLSKSLTLYAIWED